MTIKKSFFPLLLLIAGFITIGSVVLPLSFSVLRYYFLRPPVLMDPQGNGGNGPFVVNVLGVTTTDYSAPANWFVSPPSAPAVKTNVKYFTLTIPRLKMLNIPVQVNGNNLNNNAIHFSGTALPGTKGNAVIIGHSALPQYYRPGNPLTIFNPLPDIKIGDEIIINFAGVSFRYLIRSTQEINPTQVDVLFQPLDRTDLTLITCVPLGTFWHRFVARAELVN